MKRKLTLSVESKLIDSAKASGINLSGFLEAQLRIRMNTYNQNKNTPEAGPEGFEPSTTGLKAPFKCSFPEIEQYLAVEAGLAKATIDSYLIFAREVLLFCDGPITPKKLQDYLKWVQGQGLANSSYNNRLCFLSHLTEMLDLDFKARFKPRPAGRYIELPTLKQVGRGYEALESLEYKAIYLLTLTTGLRKSEVTDMKPSQLRIGRRLVIPGKASRTKLPGFGFFTNQAAEVLKQYKKEQGFQKDRVFVIGSKRNYDMWKLASKGAKVKLRPQILRVLFSSLCAKQGVPDRVTDIFQGRAPKRVIAKCYTSLGLEELHRVYQEKFEPVLTL